MNMSNRYVRIKLWLDGYEDSGISSSSGLKSDT